MRKILIIFCLIVVNFISNAASPIEVVIDSITYRIDMPSESALVVNADSSIKNANIQDTIKYEEKMFPVETIYTSAFDFKVDMKSIHIPPSVKVFMGLSFNYCRSLENVYIKDLSAWCKAYFYMLESNPLKGSNLNVNDSLVQNLIIPDDVEQISAYAFKGCKSIVSVTTPNSLSSISLESFAQCSHLKTVDLGANIKEVANDAFSKCDSLYTFYVRAINPPRLSRSYVDGFQETYPELMTLHIPEGTKEAYEKANGWKDFGTIIDDLPNDTGVNNVTIDKDLPISIFNLNGICVYRGIGNYSLPFGIYIVKQGSNCKKIEVR